MSRSRGETLFTTRSPIVIVPEVGLSSPATSLSAVVFPQPEGPTRIRNSPSSIFSERSCSATTSLSNHFVTWSRITCATRSSLQSGGGDAAHEIPLREEEQEQDRKHAHDVGRHQQIRGALVRGLEGREG